MREDVEDPERPTAAPIDFTEPTSAAGTLWFTIPAMGTRQTHLVGSIPGETPREAMELALSELGPSLRTLPDGETGERYSWILHIVEGMRRNPDLELSKDGKWTDYDDIPQFKVRKGRKLDPAKLELQHVAPAKESLPVFRELVADREIDFQVGFPGDLDMSFFVLGPNGLRHRKAFTAAAVREVELIRAEAGDSVVFQIEVPFELVGIAKAPAPLRPAIARYFARGIAKLAAACLDGSRFGIHLCLGDMRHKSLATMSDSAPVVALANAIARAWPSGRPLEFIHAPFAAAAIPPTEDPAWYSPLAGLLLKPGTRFIAGFAHEDQDLEVQRRILATIETAVGGPVGVSNACGLGRRDPVAAAAAMRRIAELAES